MGAYFGNVSGNVVIEDFEDMTDLKVNRGVFDAEQNTVYAINRDGEKAFITGFGAAME